MAVMDEFKEEREALKNGSFKERLSYFWDYYRWHVIIGIIAIILITMFIYEMVTRKADAFYGVFVNSYADENAAEFTGGFEDVLGIDTQKQRVSVDSSIYINRSSYDETTMASVQKLMAFTTAGEIDVLAADAETFEQYANTGTFADLREVLTPEQAEALTPFFYYIDQAVVDEKDKQQELDDAYRPEYPDPAKPEAMEQPIPVAVFLQPDNKLFNYYYFSGEDVVMGIVVNSGRLEEAKAFFDYALDTLPPSPEK